MAKIKNVLGMGIKVLSPAEATQVDLGPLTDLTGNWTGKPGDGWNVIAVPALKNQGGFLLEVIPYKETLKFTPIITAANRGPIVNNTQEVQQVTGLIYEQLITSVCTTPFCKARGFESGQMIHAETGLLLNVKNFNGNLNIARLSTIPHGNSLLALGQSTNALPADNNFFGVASTKPTTVQGGPPPLGYAETQYFKQQFPDFNQLDPNTFLKKTLGKQKITSMTTLNLSTDHSNAGILNIPFIQQNVNTTKFNATFWIEKIKSSAKGKPDFMQLQYTQTINLVFPATGTTLPIIWPHVTINTLTKTAS